MPLEICAYRARQLASAIHIFVLLLASALADAGSLWRYEFGINGRNAAVNVIFIGNKLNVTTDNMGMLMTLTVHAATECKFRVETVNF